MHAREFMATDVVTIAPDAPLHLVAGTMVEREISGLPVVDNTRNLLGLVTEGDLLHRLAAADTRPHGYLWGVVRSISRQAENYARAHGTIAADVMTAAEDLVTATEETTAEHIAKVMQDRRIGHMPVLDRGGRLCGMVTHRHLLRLASQPPARVEARAEDSAIRHAVRKAMREQPWADPRFTFVDVADGVVTFSGLARNERVKRGLRAIAREVPGVRDVVFVTARTPRYWIGAP